MSQILREKQGRERERSGLEQSQIKPKVKFSPAHICWFLAEEIERVTRSAPGSPGSPAPFASPLGGFFRHTFSGRYNLGRLFLFVDGVPGLGRLHLTGPEDDGTEERDNLLRRRVVRDGGAVRGLTEPTADGEAARVGEDVSGGDGVVGREGRSRNHLEGDERGLLVGTSRPRAAAMSFVSGMAISEKRSMQHLKNTVRPMNSWTSSLQRGVGRETTASIFAGSVEIPSPETTQPRKSRVR
ncbi:hypothetical protein BDK51DRAFT_27123 [Blyttiomyces helicus]|uniref:Uncharacterized protein n=1 Tax=Blyttiomyces helicus TaxID=388810 RepID=A0A4P9W6V0_9FUNG|nr:hypothetical protein BDK51DRAFT_27123 [Blyttiomyces helicus]|eukprot:RKO88064.1 hypothetical protein BDK51DRAFT_27123 [Blyttiomyces helicus]